MVTYIYNIYTYAHMLRTRLSYTAELLLVYLQNAGHVIWDSWPWKRGRCRNNWNPQPHVETINRKFFTQQWWLKGDWLMIFMVIGWWLAVIGGDWWWFSIILQIRMIGSNGIFKKLLKCDNCKNGADLIYYNIKRVNRGCRVNVAPPA